MRQKVEYLNLRILPSIKEALRTLASRDHRSIANMVEILVRERCRDAGITIPEDEPKQKKQVKPNAKPGRA